MDRDRPCYGHQAGISCPRKCQDGRINHYVVKSEAELKVKCSRGWPLDYAWCNDTLYLRYKDLDSCCKETKYSLRKD
ncbi:hypothetical protein R83H12_01050 [Fibrobacteria bacterium R8-3-H12]